MTGGIMHVGFHLCYGRFLYHEGRFRLCRAENSASFIYSSEIRLCSSYEKLGFFETNSSCWTEYIVASDSTVLVAQEKKALELVKERHYKLFRLF